MIEADFYSILENKNVRCNLCPWNCTIALNKTGLCRVRKNIDGKLFSLVYNRPISINIDPIEKKPLFHFFPGSKTLSIGTFGCNMFCRGCQNCEISKEWMEENIPKQEISAQEIINMAKEHNCDIISFTYNEPTIFYEYMLEIATLAKKNNIKTVMVSNGYMNKKPLQKLLNYIDAANIDLKGFNEEFYKKYTKAKLRPVLESIITLKKNKVWVELTNLIIPQNNDNYEMIEEMCRWILKNCGKKTPIHFSRFFPMYKARDIEITNLDTLFEARRIAKKYLEIVYLGNVSYSKIGNEYENTYCESCKKILIERKGYDILKNNIKKNKCINCHTKISGVFE